MSKAFQRHYAAITSGEVTKTNVFGLRKALNKAARAANGWSVSDTAAITEEEAIELDRAVEKHEPRVVGELHDSGVAVLRNPRYAKRWTAGEAAIIADLDSFRLVGFDPVGSTGHVPRYRAVARNGASFEFVNVPWQSGGNGPEVV